MTKYIQQMNLTSSQSWIHQGQINARLTPIVIPEKPKPVAHFKSPVVKMYESVEKLAKSKSIKLLD